MEEIEEDAILRQEWLKYAFEKDKQYLLVSIGSVGYFFNMVYAKNATMPIYLLCLSILVISGFSFVILMLFNIFEKNQEFAAARISGDVKKEEEVKEKLMRCDNRVKWTFLASVVFSVLFLLLPLILSVYDRIHSSNKKTESFMGNKTYFVGDSIAQYPAARNTKKIESEKTAPDLLKKIEKQKPKEEKTSPQNNP